MNNIKVKSIFSDIFTQTFPSFKETKPTLENIFVYLNDVLGISTSIDETIINKYQKDASNLNGDAIILCRPCTDVECSHILAICNELELKITISAGRTNLLGSATPLGGLILSTEKMIEPKVSVCIDNKAVTSSVGIFLEDMRSEVLKQSNNKLCYPVNPTSRFEATVGGTIACNSSGFSPGVEGATRHWTDYLEFLTPDGYKVCCRRGQFISNKSQFIFSYPNKEIIMQVPSYPLPKIKNASGPFSVQNGRMDLVDLIVGSEGLFGLVTLANFRIKEMPKDFLDIFLTVPNEEDAVSLQSFLLDYFDGSLSSITALEFLGHNCQKFMDNSEKYFDNESEQGIYIQVPLNSDSLEEISSEWFNILSESGSNIDLDRVKILSSKEQKEDFFTSRHSIPSNAWETCSERGTFNLTTDAIVPAENFQKFLDLSHDLFQKSDIEYLLFGHLGDCHLHFHFIPRANQETLVLDTYESFIDITLQLGGVYSGEHGTGKLKKKDFEKCFGEEGVNQVTKSKKALDSKLILNRGNVID